MSAEAVQEPSVEGVHVLALAFDRLLANGLVFASRNATTPVLDGVHLTYSDTQVTASATDQFCLYRERMGAEVASSADFSVLIRSDDVRTLRQLIACALRGAGRTNRQALTVHLVHDGDLRVQVGPLTASISGSEAGFPDVDTLIAKAEADVTDKTYGLVLDTALLAKLAAVGDSKPWTLSQAAALKPVLARPLSTDRDVVVLIMPVRPS